MSDTLQVSEIFYTCQMEGPYLGHPAVFLRLAQCNLHCSWYGSICDTFYTWNWGDGTPNQHGATAIEKDEVKVKTLEDIHSEIVKYNCKHLVISGGEPLIWQKKLVPLLERIRSTPTWPEWIIEVETNGTIPPNDAFWPMITQFNVSPKLASSSNEQRLRDRPQAISKFVDILHACLKPSIVFKYVVAKPEDVQEVMQLVQKYNIPRENVILMAEGYTHEEQMKKSQWVIELCKQHGFRYTPRAHISVYGPKRGV